MSRAGRLRRSACTTLGAEQHRIRHGDDQRQSWPARSVPARSPKRTHAGAAQAHLSAAPTVDDLASCDLVIEAATENESVKRKIFADLCPLLKPEAIIATNTSSISITRLASATDRPETLHRHALHEPGAGDAAGRADSRHRHRRRDLRHREGLRRASSARRSPCRRISRPSSSTASCCR